MRKSFVAAILALALLPLGALDLAREELESSASAAIVFVNYEGPQALIESAAAIRGIGRELGSPEGGRARAGASSRYAVIRARDPSLSAGFEADILVLGGEAQVDHIDNLRRIIAGYLESAWGYSGRDADTLAVFITVYNAVHRGELAYFGSRYKPVVLRELGPENAGLSTRWDEWPGKSRIVIPLSSGARAGSLGAVDTGAISEKAVVGNLQEQPGKGVGDRQALVDIKEREVEEKKAELGKSAAEIARDEAALAAEAQKLAAERAALEADKAAAAKAAEEGQAGASGAAAGSAELASGGAGAAEEASLALREAELAAKEKEAAAAQAALDAKKASAEADKAAVAAKEAEVAADRVAVSADQRAVIAEEVGAKARSEAAGLYLFEVVDAGYPFARVVFVDAESGTLIRASTLNSIRARTVLDSGEGFVAIAGKEGGTGAVRLVKLDKASLLVVAEGRSDIYPESALARIGESFFAVVRGEGGRFYLGRFGADLAEAARSKEAVNPYAFIAPGSGGLIVQAAGGGFLVLDAQSLGLLKRLGP